MPLSFSFRREGAQSSSSTEEGKHQLFSKTHPLSLSLSLSLSSFFPFFNPSLFKAFILPFYNVFLNSHGISAAELGLLAALRPAVGAPAAAAVAAFADRTGRHRAVLATSFLLAALGRLAVPLDPGNFSFQLALALATEVVAAPISVIADAAVVAAAPTEDG